MEKSQIFKKIEETIEQQLPEGVTVQDFKEWIASAAPKNINIKIDKVVGIDGGPPNDPELLEDFVQRSFRNAILNAVTDSEAALSKMSSLQESL